MAKPKKGLLRRNKNKNDVFGIPLVLGILFVVLLVAIASLANWTGLQEQLKTAEPSASESPGVCYPKQDTFKSEVFEATEDGSMGEAQTAVLGRARERAKGELIAAYGDTAGLSKSRANEKCQYLADGIAGPSCDEDCSPTKVDPSKGQHNPSSYALDPVPYKLAHDKYDKCVKKATEGIKTQWTCTAGYVLACSRRLACELAASPSPDKCVNPMDKKFLGASGKYGPNVPPVSRAEEARLREAVKELARREVAKKVGDGQSPVTQEEALAICGKLVNEGKNGLAQCPQMGCEPIKLDWRSLEEVDKPETWSWSACTYKPEDKVECTGFAILDCLQMLECAGTPIKPSPSPSPKPSST